VWIVMIKSFNTLLLYKIVNKILRSYACIKKIKKVSHPDEIQNIIIYYYIIFASKKIYSIRFIINSQVIIITKLKLVI
jgi:hypothetical protein